LLTHRVASKTEISILFKTGFLLRVNVYKVPILPHISFVLYIYRFYSKLKLLIFTKLLHKKTLSTALICSK
jgi:hypothetical protein